MPSSSSCSETGNTINIYSCPPPPSLFSLELARKCLAMQLEELETIASIFCGHREMVIDDPGIIVDMHSFIAQETEYLNRKLDYRVYVTPTGLKDRLEVFVELPHYYPELELPVVTISYPNISTQQHHLLRSLVEDALRKLQQPETFLFQFISWIQDDEEVRKVLLNTMTTATTTNQRPEKEPEKLHLERLWIYSHHIRSKRKLETVIENARVLQLSGFTLLGKPGIICVEGYQRDTQEFWRIVKAMHWQRIQLRLEEVVEETRGATAASDEELLAKFRKFNKFEEESKSVVVCGATAADNDNNNNNNNDSDDDNQNNESPTEDEAAAAVLRLNMSTFSTFLEQHDCGHVMASFFGFK